MEINRIISFDRTEVSQCSRINPATFSELIGLGRGPLIARGAGLSYCNAAAIDHGVCVDMTKFDRILSFDDNQGFVVVEGGVRIGDLNRLLVEKGWLLPVLPGYPFITIGGCIAFNVHGKSQHKTGTFLEWVEELNLYHPLMGELKCSRIENGELFNLTVGGMGFTGIIVSAKLRVRKIAGDKMTLQTMVAKNIFDAVNIMLQKEDEYDYVYSWNNFNCTELSFGKGIVYLEKIDIGFSKPRSRKAYRNRLLYQKGPGLMNKFTIRQMCRAYYFFEKLKPSMRNLHLIEDAFPIYGKEIYYHLFGKNGLREYQVLFPFSTWQNAAEEIKDLVAASDIGIALGSLKIFQGDRHNISFSGEGICFSIDVVNNKRGLIFFDALDEITKRNKGIINLSKDSRAGSEFVQAVFPQYAEFKKGVQRFDHQRVFVSDLRNRIEV
jgi:decaprenylphospho-beta-D-ribofuranose 2-oxidase